MAKEKAPQTERIYQWHLKQKAKGKGHLNNAAIARLFHCSREWVRLVIIKGKAKRQSALDARALEIAHDNQNTADSLNE